MAGEEDRMTRSLLGQSNGLKFRPTTDDLTRFHNHNGPQQQLGRPRPEEYREEKEGVNVGLAGFESLSWPKRVHRDVEGIIFISN